MYIWFYRLASHQWLAWAETRRDDRAGGTRAPACADARPPENDSTPAGALVGLTSRERLVFALKTHQRLALYTVAQVLDLPEETVSRIFTRAVAKLRMPRR